jgi:hypothetical protein
VTDVLVVVSAVPYRLTRSTPSKRSRISATRSALTCPPPRNRVACDMSLGAVPPRQAAAATAGTASTTAGRRAARACTPLQSCGGKITRSRRRKRLGSTVMKNVAENCNGRQVATTVAGSPAYRGPYSTAS